MKKGCLGLGWLGGLCSPSAPSQRCPAPSWRCLWPYHCSGGRKGATTCAGGGDRQHGRESSEAMAAVPGAVSVPCPPPPRCLAPGAAQSSWEQVAVTVWGLSCHDHSAAAAAAMKVPWLLLASVLLLPPGGAADPLPTLAPPLTMVVSGQRRRLVVCVVSELPASSGHAVWISGGNGSALQSFAYGASQEEGGTVCAVSILPDSPAEQELLACHVGPNSSAPAHSSGAIAVAGSDEEAELCPSTPAEPRACAAAALLVAARVVLLKAALVDALLTALLLARR
ncbi:pre T-cell antigen receptor alpha isoform X2 [Phasianus colchicus]|uniref:pre T-cell antigen receptor alpha isoform X2 n=1 Tax=Phasianus colchicus TaxID=9054 RepID=UPI00129D911C|nr:pre T-cell antigen receptor alpha isoform X2 [Phasianus colchicus]